MRAHRLTRRTSRTRTRNRTLLGVAGLLGVVAVLAGTAAATVPGKNGSLAFRRYLNADRSWGAVFTIGIDGKGARQVTHPPRGIIDDQPSWSPDGSLIAFTRCADGALCHTFVVAPDGSGLAPIGALCPEGANEQSCSDDANVSFSPDSKRVVLTQSTGRVREDSRGEGWIEHSGLAVMNRDGSGRHVVYQRAAFSGDLDSPVFSPDGKKLAFEFDRSGFTKPSKRASTSSGSTARARTNSPRGRRTPETTPTGRRTASGSCSTRTWRPERPTAVLRRPPRRDRTEAAHPLPPGYVGRAGVLLAGRQLDRFRQGARGRQHRRLHDGARR